MVALRHCSFKLTGCRGDILVVLFMATRYGSNKTFMFRHGRVRPSSSGVMKISK